MTTDTTISKEDRDKRVKLAKALYFTELGDAKPSSPKEREAAFDAVKKDMVQKAIKLEKTLERLGYKVTQIS